MLRRKKPVRRRKKKIPRLLMLVVGLLVAVFLIMEFLLMPTIVAFAEAEAHWRATEIINEAVLNSVVDNMEYDKLVYIERDNNNRILYMQQNLVQINKINSKATLAIQESLKDLQNAEFKIPLGQVTGSKLLANYGPDIGLWLLPLGTVSVKVQDRFEEAGINQTRHKIYLNVHSDIRVVIPLIDSRIAVDTQVPVADTVIVGEVPETYLKIDMGAGGALFGASK